MSSDERGASSVSPSTATTCPSRSGLSQRRDRDVRDGLDPGFPTHASGPGGRALAEDFSQAEDLADQHPDKVRELRDKFMAAAAKYNVFPLDDRFAERLDTTLRPSFFGWEG